MGRARWKARDYNHLTMAAQGTITLSARKQTGSSLASQVTPYKGAKQCGNGRRICLYQAIRPIPFLAHCVKFHKLRLNEDKNQLESTA
jgi:hypothetical protein